MLSSGLGAHVMSRRPLPSVGHRTSGPPFYVLCTELHFQLALTLNMCFLRPQDINVTEQHLHKRPCHIYQDPILLPIKEEKFCGLPSFADSKENKLWHPISKMSLSLDM